ncbi:MAG TPA: CHAT domain-containing tetratricopeptide repeat protein [Lapillicoccus sp.]|uniref:CHAT domain-containing protein n=1 Tax=Lapillicoccus sp. TaxID=1909287 RepID=UPI002E0CEC2A|nr:CHAT domain-containing tetratricopeptide repeat protein [Blastococcus sp.]
MPGTAISDPERALAAASSLLREDPDDVSASYAHQAIAIVLRQRGSLEQALEHAGQALRRARRVDQGRVADVLATRGATFVMAGHAHRGVKELDRAVALAQPADQATIYYRRGGAMWLLGRHEAAIQDLDEAIRLCRQQDIALWEGRALSLRGDVRRARGEFELAIADLAESEAIFTAIGATSEATIALHNRACVALDSGDLIKALTLMSSAGSRYAAEGFDPVELVLDRAEALLVAGLASEARDLVDAKLLAADDPPLRTAELLLASGKGALADGEPLLAVEKATASAALFRSHGRARLSVEARLVSAEARYASLVEDHTTLTQEAQDLQDVALDELRLLAEVVRRLVRSVRLHDPRGLPTALLLQARVAHARGRSGRAFLEEAATARGSGPPLDRATGWLAAALLAEEGGDRRAMFHACRVGLDAVDEHRAVIGDMELRARAAMPGLDLAELAVRAAATSGRARQLLWWAERWRGTALVDKPARSPSVSDLGREAGALRDVSRRLNAHPDDDGLARERDRLEAAVRARYRQLQRERTAVSGPNIPELIHDVGTSALVSLMRIDATLYAVVVSHGRATKHVIGPYERAVAEANFARFALRRAAYGRTGNLEHTAERLQAALFADALPSPVPDALVIAPPASLLSAPFGLLPGLRGSAISVTPSASLWQKAVRTPTVPGGTGVGVTLVTGPGLSTRQQEVTHLEEIHHTATVLRGRRATVDASLSALDGARLGHIAAHGVFRADAPLFSSLMLWDGPLMLHDLDRLTQPPRSVVLSACDSGGLMPLGQNEALGLVSGLLAIGCRSVVASVVPVNDAATVSVMAEVHSAVAVGGSLAEGLLAARTALAQDPLLAATAASFTAWGA